MARKNTPAQDLFASLVFLAIGVALVWFGFQGSSDECGGEKMSSGDTCVSYANGEQTGSKNLDEQESDNSTTSNVLLGVGGLIILGSAWSSVGTLRKMNGSAR
ncbi:hypothetical protein [Streptomyces sp. NPDC056670]|uniref:hypothetical protein n=1 Tax=unclassified Streptomyces TaxID=2593676 RepID=UPI0036C9BF57